MKILREIFLLPVHFYKAFISPIKGGRVCAYTPSCSEYFLIAVRKHGCIKGGIMGIMRILRCTPKYFGGYDPVPDEYVWSRVKGQFTARRKPKNFDKEFEELEREHRTDE